jgi:endonuclease YncB( thermonuclease family)
MRGLWTILLAGFLLGPVPAVAGPWITGQVRVIDGDTIDVGQIRIRLHGIDAPETDQTCHTRRGEVWACGAWAKATVKTMLEGQHVRCAAVARDRYARVVARCEAREGDVGQVLVSEGIALAYPKYSLDYVPAEEKAARRNVGLHAGSFQSPAKFRRTRDVAKQHVTRDCAIKGNISRSGERIYHRPGQRDYAKTSIRTEKGERWFCSPQDAEAAGWRAARR